MKLLSRRPQLSSGQSLSFFISWPALGLYAQQKLPADLFLCLGHKLVKYRNKGDSFSPQEFDKLISSGVQTVFIPEESKESYIQWALGCEKRLEEESLASAEPEQKGIVKAAIDLRRGALDLFQFPHSDKAVVQAIDLSQKMVTEFLNRPFVINNITQLQRFDKGCVDHSVNVAVLAVFLGLRMGYSSHVILGHLALGGLMHDLGKTALQAKARQSPDELIAEDDPLVLEHPRLGAKNLEAMTEPRIAKEVQMIVAQHHEWLDGTGYPEGLRGVAIYDLARLVSIANVYDNLVSLSRLTTLKQRAEEALDKLGQEYQGKLDPRKLEKALKIIRVGLL